MGPVIRPATLADDAQILHVDKLTWSPVVTPADFPESRTEFFERCHPDEVLVAEADGGVVGYVRLVQSDALGSHAHVQEIEGFAVHPAHQGRGIGSLLLMAAVDEARRRGARKVSLRVLGTNTTAIGVYSRHGFVVEVVRRAEFVIDGRDVDDLAMAQRL